MVWIGCVALLGVGLFLFVSGIGCACACFGLTGKLKGGEVAAMVFVSLAGLALIWWGVASMPIRIVSL